MTHKLIDNLKHLDDILHKVRQHFDDSQTDVDHVEQLKNELTNSQIQQHHFAEEQRSLQQRLKELAEQYHSLTQAHDRLNEDYDELLAKCEALEQSNQALLEKNRLAKEHTKVVMQRLTMIDQAVD